MLRGMTIKIQLSRTAVTFTMIAPVQMTDMDRAKLLVHAQQLHSGIG